LTNYLSLADETSSLSRCDSKATPRKMASRNSCKNLSRSNGRVKSYGYFNPLLQSRRPDLLVTKLGFHINPKENSFRKLVQNFKGVPTVRSKVMAILTSYSSLADETSTSPRCDSKATPRKMASRNSCKNLSAIQLSGQKLWLF
jgi:hypothetical protein